MAYSTEVFKTYNHLANYLESIGNTEYKSLFFGLSININGVVVGMITFDNKVIVRSTPDTKSTLEELNLKMHTYTKQQVSVRSGYYYLCKEMIVNELFIIELFKATYQGALKVIDMQNQVKQGSLNKMPNIKVTLAKKLKDAGIRTPDELRSIGSPIAFALIRRAHGDSLSDSVLYKLEAAIQGVHEAALSSDSKVKVKDEYEAVFEEMCIPSQIQSKTTHSRYIS